VANGPPSAKFAPPWLKPLVTPLSAVFPVRKFYIEQMFVSVRMRFHNHVYWRHTTSETFRQGYSMYIRCQIWNVASAQEWDFTAQMLWWFFAIAHLQKEQSWSPGSLRDLITTTVNLNRKLGSLSSQKKIKIFQRHIFSKAFCRFPNVRMKMTVFRRGNCRPQSGKILK